MIVIYDPEHGDIVPDAKLEQYWLNNIHRSTITVGSELLILAGRALHKQGKISIQHITYNDEFISISPNGRLNPWPAGFCDSVDKYLSELLS